MNKRTEKSNIEGDAMKLILCLLVVFYGIAFPASSQLPAGAGAPGISATVPAAVEPAAAPAEQEAVAQDGGSAVSNKFTGLRDPFWPVGFSPDAGKQEEQVKAVEVEQAQAAADEELWVTLQKKLRIAGVMAFGGKKMATVNNRNVQVGDTVSVKHEGREFRWKVSEITDNNRVRFARFEVVTAEQKPAPQSPAN